MPFELDYDRGVPVYRQLFEAVVLALARGDLRPDEQLPTIHELARRLSINPNTVARAYRDLENAGYLVAERGRGTFPAKRPAPAAPKRETILQGIVDRALAECARHGLAREDLFEFMKRRTT